MSQENNTENLSQLISHTELLMFHNNNSVKI